MNPFIKLKNEIRSYDLEQPINNENCVTLIRKFEDGIDKFTSYTIIPKKLYEAEIIENQLIKCGVNQNLLELFNKFIFEFILASRITLDLMYNFTSKIDDLEAELFVECKKNNIDKEIFYEFVDLYCDGLDEYLFKRAD